MIRQPLPLLAAAALLLTGCSMRTGTSPDAFNLPLYTPEYACGFEIAGAENMHSTLVRMHNPWQGAGGVDTELFISRAGEAAPKGFAGQVLEGDASRIVCMSSSHIALLDAVGAVERVVGVSGIDYITNEYISDNRSRIGDVGYEGNIDYERLVSLRPDIVLLFGVNGVSTMDSKLRELGIPFAYIGDYLEESPLGKAEWMIVAGEITGCRSKAEHIYRAIPERYNALKAEVAAAALPAPGVMVNSPYGNSWFMSPATSFAAQLIADAGGRYIYCGSDGNRSIPIDFEQASLLVARADVWINADAFDSLGQLRRTLPRLASAPCVQSGRVWNSRRRTNSAGGNDYWESGIVHPDVILRDLVHIFHPEQLPDTEPFYCKRLE